MRSHKTGTIAFRDQNSLARLNTGTTVQITRGALSGNTVPQLVVAGGAIWGRVLTSTGINFGTNGFIVGVRGTSLSLSKDASQTQLAIVDSTKSATGTAAEIHCLGMSGVPFPAQKYSMTTVSNAVCPTSLPQSSPAQIYASQHWIRANTLKDIEKMSTLATDAAVSPRVVDELKATLPTDSVALSTLTDVPAATLPEDIAEENEIAGITPTVWTDEREKSKTRAEKLECKKDGKRYWSSLDKNGNTAEIYCQSKNLVAFADFSQWLTEMKTKDAVISSAWINKWIVAWGVAISAKGESLQYPSFPLQNLAGKKITLTINGTPNANWTLIDFWTLGRIKVFWTQYASWFNWPTINKTPLANGDTEISFTLPAGITSLTIGNNLNGNGGAISAFGLPIGLTFKKIQISN